MSQQFSKVSRGILRKAPLQMKELRLVDRVAQTQCRNARGVCPLSAIFYPLRCVCSPWCSWRDFIYLWIFFEERQPEDIFFLEAKVRISEMLCHGTFYNIEKWSLDSLSRIKDLHLACVVQTGLLLIYQQDFAWGFGLDSRGWHLHSKNLNRRRK